MFGLKRFLSLVLVFTFTLVLGNSTKSQNGHGEQRHLFSKETNTNRSNSFAGNDKNISSSDFPLNNEEIYSTIQSLKTGHTNVKNTENNFETSSTSHSLNSHAQSHQLEQELSGSTAQFSSAELFESRSSDYGWETTTGSPEADEIDSKTHVIKQSKETATMTQILNETSTVLATTTKPVTSTVPQDISSVATSTPFNVHTIQSKSPSRTKTSVVKVSEPASKLSSARKDIETSVRTTTWGTIKSSIARHQTKSSELSFKQNGGAVEKSDVTDGQDLMLKENKTSEHVRPTIPCDFTRQGNYYDSSSLIAAAVGGAFVGGALVLAAFYCKQRFYRYLRGDYRRVPMEYDFELNPRLKYP